MRKRPYRSVDVNRVVVPELVEQVAGAPVFVGIDVAKYDMYAAVMDDRQRVLVTVRWRQPTQMPAFLALLSALSTASSELSVAMEPTGVYGDALRVAIASTGVPVYRVSAKRAHDAKEVYDGVPSLHDAKSAAIVAKLHADGCSGRWTREDGLKRQMQALTRVLAVHEEYALRNRGRLEGLTARHWPEVTEHLRLKSATLLELLSTYGSAQAVATDVAGARALMRRVGGAFQKAETIEAVLCSAAETVGVVPLPAEVELVRVIAAETRRAQSSAQAVSRRLEQMSDGDPVVERMAAVVGWKTAAVLLAALGDVSSYGSAGALLKAAGLNLKEKSSGLPAREQSARGLHITKRGPGVVRKLLWMAALRRVYSDPIVRAWYAKKVQRDGGRHRSRAVVAVMRKLLSALWHVSRGATYDARLLFDTRRLVIEPVAAGAEVA